MNDTPRTDAAAEWVRPCGNDSAPPNEQYVAIEFARDLERLHAKLGKTLLEYERLLLIAANNANDSEEEDSFQRQILEAINRK